MEITLLPHTVHIWRVYLKDLLSQQSELMKLLNSDELTRAHRFHFEKHQQQFSIARGILRKILSLYTEIPPEGISFKYGHKGKPYLEHDHLRLQFNVSHSDDVAVYAITLNEEIGIDIEQVKNEFKEEVAKRFFSKTEFSQLMLLPETEKAHAFYQLWACKEALIKAMGEGLYVPLESFSVNPKLDSQWINIKFHGKEIKFFLKNLEVSRNFCSAFATSQVVNEIIEWRWGIKGPENS